MNPKINGPSQSISQIDFNKRVALLGLKFREPILPAGRFRQPRSGTFGSNWKSMGNGTRTPPVKA